MAKQDIEAQVDPIAQQAGVPPWLLNTVIDVEDSSWNPRAYNPNDPGGSYGLLQLNRYGQLGNLTPEQAYDPITNVSVGIDAIARAWNNLKGSYKAGDFKWWEQFAIQSGHPGGYAGNQVTDNETTLLIQAATTESNGSTVTTTGPVKAPGNVTWFDAPTTQGHGNGEDGIDVGTQNDTPLAFPWGGKVLDAEYFDYGGQVAVKVPGTDAIEYFIHMDNISVKAGDTIQPWQVVGTSGGGVGDKVLHNGTVQPAQNQSWFDGHSSNYHTEFGLFKGNTMSDFDQGWHNPSNQYDPTSVVSELRASGSAQWPGGGTPNNQGNASTGGSQSGPSWWQQLMCNLMPFIPCEQFTTSSSKVAQQTGQQLSDTAQAGLAIAGSIAGLGTTAHNFLNQGWPKIFVRLGVGLTGATMIGMGLFSFVAATRGESPVQMAGNVTKAAGKTAVAAAAPEVAVAGKAAKSVTKKKPEAKTAEKTEEKTEEKSAPKKSSLKKSKKSAEKTEEKPKSEEKAE